LAYAYLQSDDEESYRRLIDEMQRVLVVQSDAGTDNFTRALSQAQLAALTGDAESALGDLQTSFDSGLRWINKLDCRCSSSLPTIQGSQKSAEV